jgi:hypothetical protein
VVVGLEDLPILQVRYGAFDGGAEPVDAVVVRLLLGGFNLFVPLPGHYTFTIYGTNPATQQPFLIKQLAWASTKDGGQNRVTAYELSGDALNPTLKLLWDLAGQGFPTDEGHIVQSSRGKCLQRMGDYSDPYLVQLFSCNSNGLTAQNWTMETSGAILSMWQGIPYCLDVDHSHTDNGTPVQAFPCNGSGAQQWRQTANGALVNPESGRCLDTPDQSADWNIAIFDCTGTASQKWTVPSVIRGDFGKCVDVDFSGTDNGTPVQLFDCNGTNAQRWTRGSNNSFQALGKCLDVAGAGTANGTKTVLFDCNGATSQQWNKGNNNTLVNAKSGRCLDVTSVLNFTQLQISDCISAAASQQWKLPTDVPTMS